MPLAWRPAQSTEPEWMDTPGHARALVEENLDDLQRVNRWLGGAWLTIDALQALLRQEPVAPDREPWLLLDVATGGADIPRAAVDWARRHGHPIVVVATDISADFVAVARDRSRAYPELLLAIADARRLPFRSFAFDVTTCSLALHHLSWDDAQAMLGELGRCARRAVVVNDIVRSWLGYVGAVLAVHLGSRNPLTRHDGPLSVRRAFTRAEMMALARRAGLCPTRWRSFLWYRVAWTAYPVGSGAGREHGTPSAGNGRSGTCPAKG